MSLWIPWRVARFWMAVGFTSLIFVLTIVLITALVIKVVKSSER